MPAFNEVNLIVPAFVVSVNTASTIPPVVTVNLDVEVSPSYVYVTSFVSGYFNPIVFCIVTVLFALFIVQLNVTSVIVPSAHS